MGGISTRFSSTFIRIEQETRDDCDRHTHARRHRESARTKSRWSEKTRRSKIGNKQLSRSLVKIVSEERSIKEMLAAPVSVPGLPRAYRRSRWSIWVRVAVVWRMRISTAAVVRYHRSPGSSSLSRSPSPPLVLRPLSFSIASKRVKRAR